MTKLRIGLVSENKELLVSLKNDLPGSYIYNSKTLYELSQNYGNLKLDAVIFTEEKQNEEVDLQASLNFLRLKNNFKDCLVFFMHQRRDFKLKGLVFDPRARAYSISGGTLIPMMQLQSLANGADPKKFEEPLCPDWLRGEFANSLNMTLGSQSEVTSAEATDDEAHSRFLCQSSNEIASNLIWIKFTARFLDEGSNEFKQQSSSLSDEEMENKAEMILSQVLATFKEQVQLRLKDEGAILLQGFDSLNANERIELIRRGRSSNLIFSTPLFRVLLEQTRYT